MVCTSKHILTDQKRENSTSIFTPYPTHWLRCSGISFCRQDQHEHIPTRNSLYIARIPAIFGKVFFAHLGNMAAWIHDLLRCGFLDLFFGVPVQRANWGMACFFLAIFPQSILGGALLVVFIPLIQDDT